MGREKDFWAVHRDFNQYALSIIHLTACHRKGPERSLRIAAALETGILLYHQPVFRFLSIWHRAELGTIDMRALASMS